MKKWLALLLCALLCQSALAAASEEVQEDAYAREIVALLEDETHMRTITLTQDIATEEIEPYGVDVYGQRDQEKILDLNGHTVSLDGLNNFANLLLTDSVGGGKLILTSTLYNQGGSVTISGANVVCAKGSGTAIYNYWPGIFCLVSGTVDATQVAYAIENHGGVCVIEDGEIRGGLTAIDSTYGTELYGISGRDKYGRGYGTTGVRWYDGELKINGGLIEGDIEAYDTDVTITGGVVRGEIVMRRSFEYEDGHLIKLETPQEMQYYNAAGETVTLPKPTYELHEDNGEMKRGYWDVPMDAWFYAPVQALMDDRVLDYGGYRDKGNFSPTEPLTRGQAAALLARACGVETQEEWDAPVFLDVAEATPYAKYINAGQKAGLLSGDGQGQFHPGSTITRQEFAVLVVNAVHKRGLELSSETPGMSFKDEDAIALWAKDAVAEGASYGLWNGTGSGDFLPLNPISRAEAAAILARISELHLMIDL